MPRYKYRRTLPAGIAIAAAVVLMATGRDAKAQSAAPQGTVIGPNGQIISSAPGVVVGPGSMGGHSGHGGHGGYGHGAGKKGCCPTHGVCHHARWQAHMAYCRDKYLGYPEEFIPRPLGEALYDNMKVMVSNGDAARMVLYDFDFQPNGARLNVKGQDRLAKIAQLAGGNFQPIIVERTPANTQLAESRRLAVLAELARNSPIPIPSERVVIGAPIAAGLDGRSAVIIRGTLDSRTSAYGPPVGENAGGGFSGGGFSQ